MTNKELVKIILYKSVISVENLMHDKLAFVETICKFFQKEGFSLCNSKEYYESCGIFILDDSDALYSYSNFNSFYAFRRNREMDDLIMLEIDDFIKLVDFYYSEEDSLSDIVGLLKQSKHRFQITVGKSNAEDYPF